MFTLKRRAEGSLWEGGGVLGWGEASVWFRGWLDWGGRGVPTFSDPETSTLAQRHPGETHHEFKRVFLFFFYLKVLYFSFLILHVKYRQGPPTVPSGTPGGSTDPLFKALDMEN